MLTARRHLFIFMTSSSGPPSYNCAHPFPRQRRWMARSGIPLIPLSVCFLLRRRRMNGINGTAQRGKLDEAVAAWTMVSSSWTRSPRDRHVDELYVPTIKR